MSNTSSLQIAIHMPRRPLPIPGQGARVLPSEWKVGSRGVIESAIQQALQLAPAEQIRIITAEGDDQLFELMSRYSVLELDLGTWLERLAEQARRAEPDDLVAVIRPEFLLLDATALPRAIEACRALSSVDRVEPAFKPEQPPIAELTAYQRDGSVLGPWHQVLGVDAATTFAFPCPAFEVLKLRHFRVDRATQARKAKSAFVWINESDVVLLETPLDFVRAELAVAGRI